jgi:hypothetical protein
MQTNSVAVDLLVPTHVPHHELPTHRALFLNMSRCNHSCDPNAVWSWNASTLTLTLAALRPISPGDEITISYISLSGNHASDRETLKKQYGFECTCEECTLPSYVAVNSNAIVYSNRVTEPSTAAAGIQASNSDKTTPDSCDLPTFEEWYQDSRLPETLLIDAHKRALRRIYQQKLASSYLTPLDTYPKPPSLDATAQLMDNHVEVIAMCYGALGDVASFRKWITISKDASGVRPDRKVVFNRWLSDPSSFPLWRRRRPRG